MDHAETLTTEMAASEALERLRVHALGLPEAFEDFPWGERVFKVRGKIFLFAGQPGGLPTFGLKLPQSREFALELPNAFPSRYGLGRSGWVTIKCNPDDPVDVERLVMWTNESYRAIAPKTLARQIG